MSVEIVNQEEKELVVITEKALVKIKEIIDQEDEDVMLRVFVTGGGCSGFQYGFVLEEELSEDDTMVEKNGIKVVVDPLSYQYLDGAEIDIKEELMGTNFVINNPNATNTCGCGSSFSV